MHKATRLGAFLPCSMKRGRLQAWNQIDERVLSAHHPFFAGSERTHLQFGHHGDKTFLRAVGQREPGV